MSNAWVRIQPSGDHGIAIDDSSGDGGPVIISERADAPAVTYNGESVAPVPLTFAAPAKGRLQLETLDYVSRPTTPLSRVMDGITLPWSTLALPVLAAIGSPETAEQRREREEREDVRLTRRQVVIGATTLLGGAALSSDEVAAAESPPVRTVAEADVTVNDRGFSVSLRNEVADVLPTDRTYLVYQDGEQLDTLTPSSPTATVPAGRTGMTSILTEADVGIMQDIRGILNDSDAVEYTVDLPKPAAEYSEGAVVNVTSETTLVTPVTEAGHDDTVITLGEASIGHAVEERTTDAGAWRVRSGTLQYLAGSDPPDATTLQVAAGVEAWTEAGDDADRILG